VKIKPADFEQAHYDLYLKYQQTRHSGSGMANSTPEEYLNFLSNTWCNTLFVELYIEGVLVAVAIVDYLDNALSAVYTFFDPDFSRYSLGSYAVLWQIQYAQKLQLPWLYLGYWINDCKKMSYKNKYRPLQAFINEEWRQFDKGEEIE
jgi:arginine-tRNA-protein transferase